MNTGLRHVKFYEKLCYHETPQIVGANSGAVIGPPLIQPESEAYHVM